LLCPQKFYFLLATRLRLQQEKRAENYRVGRNTFKLPLSEAPGNRGGTGAVETFFRMLKMNEIHVFLHFCG
jgi:hypothetical protein